MEKPNDLHNFLARGAWVLADVRTYLQSLPTTQADILCERIDDFFSETYSWLKSHPEEAGGPTPSSVQRVETYGVDWKSPTGRDGQSSNSPVEDTPEPAGPPSPEASSGASSGIPTTKRFVGFF